MGHILERSVGCAEEVEAEIGEEVLLVRDDRLVLCTDGFWATVEENEIRDLFGTGPLRDAVERGIGLALARGADDNTTIGALEFVGADRVADAPTGAGGTLREAPALTSEALGLVEPTADRARSIRLLVGAVVGILALTAIVLVFLATRDGESEPNPDEPESGQQEEAEADEQPGDEPETEPSEGDGEPETEEDPTDRK
jgi:hypothetical protein